MTASQDTVSSRSSVSIADFVSDLKLKLNIDGESSFGKSLEKSVRDKIRIVSAWEQWRL